MHLQALALLLAASSAAAQSVVGAAYGFATGVTGGGSVTAVTPKDADELTKLLSDDVARTILIDKTFDFTGTLTTGAGCQRIECSVSKGGQYFLGDLSCGGSDVTPVASITYDAASDTPLIIGSNKSIVGVGGKGVIKGKGLRLAKGASNVIIQGVELTTINPGICWGGDALDFQGSNDGVWVDHCKFALTGRMFVVSHYTASRITLSNNEFDGNTDTSSTCNGNHYWGLMFIADGDQVTLDRNYFHDQSGRAPKLGADGVSGTFHATNNYFENMKGHAFDAYTGTTALIEGNAFKAVNQPTTQSAQGVSTIYTVAGGGAACSSALGRDCAANSVDSASGKLAGGESSGVLSTMAKVKQYLVTPIEASKVAALVVANAGPANIGVPSDSSSGVIAKVESSISPAATTNAAVAATTKLAIAMTSTTATSTSVVVPEVECDDGGEAPEPSAPSAAPTSASSTLDNSPSGPVKLYERCGGEGYTGPTTCESGATCKEWNPWYSQCVAASARARRMIREGGFPGKGKGFRSPFPMFGNRTVTF